MNGACPNRASPLPAAPSTLPPTPSTASNCSDSEDARRCSHQFGNINKNELLRRTTRVSARRNCTQCASCRAPNQQHSNNSSGSASAHHHRTIMSFGNRRKRGRPRRGETSTINDVDLALINEFQQRPAFYDRTHPQYRNREFLEPQWLEMARNVGQNVSVVKNRLIQLRNRYNLEKRRVETLQEQYNDPNITSQWPLYEYLTFLGDHIKSRRSLVKPLMSLHAKMRLPSESSESDNCDKALPFIPPRQMHQPPPPLQQSVPNSAPVSVESPKNMVLSAPHSATNGIALDQPIDGTVNLGNDKFKAFGQFLASSLIEMNEKDALRLVEKFTSELVKSLLSDQSAKITQQQHEQVHSNILHNANNNQQQQQHYVSAVAAAAKLGHIN